MITILGNIPDLDRDVLTPIFDDAPATSWRGRVWHVGQLRWKGDEQWARLTSWHQDGGARPDTPVWAVVWSNIAPTEFLTADDGVFVPEPGSVVLFNNKLVHHRMPDYSDAEARERKFFRAYPRNLAIDSWRRQISEQN